VIVQEGFARKRTAVRPQTLLTLGWLPWWRLQTERQLPAAFFEPRPGVDAALLVATRRTRALLDASEAPAYRGLLARGFRAGNRPLRTVAPASALAWKRFARDRGLPLDARAHHLDLWDWIALHRLAAPKGVRPRMVRWGEY
jgi:16S rRNA A1518/A1519 N6-dimethyltransferase RsmA/KsgA/DIM1 with predicted DNA glycosylase/AP lyase activity